MDKKLLIKINEHSVPTVKLPVRYILKPSIEVIDGYKILFVSFFDQKNTNKKCKSKAYIKLYIHNDDYISQVLQEDGSYKWRDACLYNLIGWGYYGDLQGSCDTLEERITISSYLKVQCPAAGNEISIIKEFQSNVMAARLQKKHNKILNKIDEAMKKVPPLPKNFDKWVYNGPFNFSRYIYYKRSGKNINCFCTECKNEFVITETIKTKNNIKKNKAGKCPKCKRNIVYKAEGITKKLCDYNDFAIMQKYEGGFIVRYFSGYKSYQDHFKEPVLKYREDIRRIMIIKNNNLIVTKYEYAFF